jgi:hypothetical protein
MSVAFTKSTAFFSGIEPAEDSRWMACRTSHRIEPAFGVGHLNGGVHVLERGSTYSAVKILKVRRNVTNHGLEVLSEGN